MSIRGSLGRSQGEHHEHQGSCWAQPNQLWGLEKGRGHRGTNARSPGNFRGCMGHTHIKHICTLYVEIYTYKTRNTYPCTCLWTGLGM